MENMMRWHAEEECRNAQAPPRRRARGCRRGNVFSDSNPVSDSEVDEQRPRVKRRRLVNADRDRNLVPPRIIVSHVDARRNLLDFGALPHIPENLTPARRIELNTIQVQIVALRAERTIIEEARAQLRLRRLLI